MSARVFLKRAVVGRVRLLPAVMALAGTLFVVKAVGLARDARAQDAQTAPPAAAEPVTATRLAAADDGETSSSEIDVLTSLSKRRAELDVRAREIQTQQDLLNAAEKRVDEKIAALKALQTQIQTLLAQRDSAEDKQIQSLVKSYASMKPRDAARIFNNLAEDVLLSVSAQMKPDVLGAILAQMQPEAAQKLTVKLANRLKPSDTPPAAQQVASTTAPAPVAAPAPTQSPAPASPPPAAAPSSSPAESKAAPAQTQGR